MMWERKETGKDTSTGTTSAGVPAPPAPRYDAAATAAATAVAHAARGRAANVGTSLFIKGEVSGSEDMTVEGHIEGRIDLKDHNLTIAASGKVQAEVHAKSVTIHGEVTGNVIADEKIEISDTGRVTGDVKAPRVAISDGAQFRGSVDMTRGGHGAPVIRDRADRAVVAATAAVSAGAPARTV